MSEVKTLSAFFKENEIVKEPVKYVASKRFVDANGDPVEWELRALTNDEIDTLQHRCQKKVPVKGTRDYQTVFDRERFTMEFTLKSIVYPNLNDTELQTNRGVVGAEALLKDLLTPGELADLYLASSEASDFQTGMDDKIKTVKNLSGQKTPKQP
ncbi:hypothetical protein [uncultured Megasphaera sp.]|uniref:phage tail assembly chaperone n=1 Tax=uncultured Megasphaera sp. TaxID=165188 RepID=UPI002657ED25|nr:hypothetical protein [uncultured Megasphaera sp.]